jgi:hypothetical protein
MANYNELPQDMQKEIADVAAAHKCSLETAVEYYLMGGKDHADLLCKLRDAGASDVYVRQVSKEYWDRINKVYYRELMRSASLLGRIKNYLKRLFNK